MLLAAAHECLSAAARARSARPKAQPRLRAARACVMAEAFPTTRGDAPRDARGQPQPTIAFQTLASAARAARARAEAKRRGRRAACVLTPRRSCGKGYQVGRVVVAAGRRRVRAVEGDERTTDATKNYSRAHSTTTHTLDARRRRSTAPATPRRRIDDERHGPAVDVDGAVQDQLPTQVALRAGACDQGRLLDQV